MHYTQNRNCYTPCTTPPTESLGSTALSLLTLALGFIGFLLLAGGLG